MPWDTDHPARSARPSTGGSAIHRRRRAKPVSGTASSFRTEREPIAVNRDERYSIRDYDDCGLLPLPLIFIVCLN
jgi:hypothetical protein